MKIRLLSDLHTEFRLPYKTHTLSEYRGEDVLVLAGDIASGATNTMDVIKHFLDQGFLKLFTCLVTMSIMEAQSSTLMTNYLTYANKHETHTFYVQAQLLLME